MTLYLEHESLDDFAIGASAGCGPCHCGYCVGIYRTPLNIAEAFSFDASGGLINRSASNASVENFICQATNQI